MKSNHRCTPVFSQSGLGFLPFLSPLYHKHGCSADYPAALCKEMLVFMLILLFSWLTYKEMISLCLFFLLKYHAMHFVLFLFKNLRLPFKVYVVWCMETPHGMIGGRRTHSQVFSSYCVNQGG